MNEYIIYITLLYVYVIRIVLSDEPGEKASENQNTCRRIGPQCSTDGKFVDLCTKLNLNSTVKISCQTNEICKEEEGFVGCVPIESNTRTEFICNDIGEFPDPFNCSRTFVCNEKNNKPYEVCWCPSNSSVSPTDLSCSPGDCQWKDITCSNKIGTFGYFTMKDNDKKTNLCYYCQKSAAIHVFKDCDTSDKQQTAYRVRLDEGKNCELYNLDYEKMTTATTQSTINTQSQTTSYVFSTNKVQRANEMPDCKNVGDLHKSECDCDYYKCNKELKPVRKTCLDGMVFREKYQKCFFGDCDVSKCTGRSNS